MTNLIKFGKKNRLFLKTSTGTLNLVQNDNYKKRDQFWKIKGRYYTEVNTFWDSFNN